MQLAAMHARGLSQAPLLVPCSLACRIHYKPRLPLHGTENLAMAFDFMKAKEKNHIVNIGKCRPEGRGGEGVWWWWWW